MPSFRCHSIRFYRVEPRAIHCMAHSPLLDCLAVSRSDNSVELWDTRAGPVLTRCIPGNAESSVESLCWVGGRLFSCGLHGLVVEYDLDLLCEKSRHSVTSGPAWCLAVDATDTRMAVGTEEGFVCLFSVGPDGGGLEYEKVLDKQEGRILCLAWHSGGEHIVTGSTDTIRVWNYGTGHPVARMTTGRAERHKETIIWSLAVTADMTVISGDSRGKTSFWNGKLGTLIDSIQSHKADVLAVTVNKEETVAYSSGVDPTIMHFQIISKPDGRRKWVKSLHRQVNSHDVRSLVSHRDRIYSGGVDSYLTVSSYPARTVTRLPPLPAPGNAVCVAAAARCVLLRMRDHLELWRLGDSGTTTSGAIGTVLPLRTRPVKLVRIDAKDGETIVNCEMSDDGTWLAYSTATRTRLYRLADVTEAVPTVKRVAWPSGADTSRQLLFYRSEKGGWNVLAASAERPATVQLVSLDCDTAMLEDSLGPAETRLAGGVTGLCLCDGDGGERRAVVRDRHDNVVVLDLASRTVLSKLPAYGGGCISGLGASRGRVVVAYSDQRLVECDAVTGKYTHFSHTIANRLPREWSARRTPVTNIRFVSPDSDLIVLHDDSTLAVLDKDKEAHPEPQAKVLISDPRLTPDESLDDSVSSTGSTRPGGGPLDQATPGLTVTRKFHHLVHFSHIGKDEVVVVEVKPASLEEQLPPSLKQKKFGTG